MDVSQASSLLNILRRGLAAYQGCLNVDGHIVLVEADIVLGAVVAEVLRHSGYKVLFVRTLKGEIDQVLNYSVSAVILDVDTASLDRELPRLGLLQLYISSLPIVLMGMQTPNNLQQRLLPHLAQQEVMHLVWVQKPFRNEELLAAVRQAQGSHSSQPTHGV